MSVESILKTALAKQRLSVPVEPFVAYLQLLNKWNQAYNLTAIRDIDVMARRHVLDSLAILPWIKGKRVIDVGSGPGLPGIPIALAAKHYQIVLLDSNGKKTRFLYEVKRELNLSNVEVVQKRAECYQPNEGFDTVVTRAFSALDTMIQWTQHLLAPQGIWLAMKGPCSDSEINSVSYPYDIKSYTIPGVEGERRVVIIKKG